jgi:hypothetical protein
LGVIFEHCTLWPRDLGTKEFGAKVFGELLSVVLEDKGDDKMVR